MKKIYCTKCGKECTPEGIAAGCGVIPETEDKICCSCCGELDKQQPLNAKPGDKFCFYLTVDGEGGCYAANWPGSFKIRVGPRKGHHNIAGVRYDFWFTFGHCGACAHGGIYFKAFVNEFGCHFNNK